MHMIISWWVGLIVLTSISLCFLWDCTYYTFLLILQIITLINRFCIFVWITYQHLLLLQNTILSIPTALFSFKFFKALSNFKLMPGSHLASLSMLSSSSNTASDSSSLLYNASIHACCLPPNNGFHPCFWYCCLSSSFLQSFVLFS